MKKTNKMQPKPKVVTKPTADSTSYFKDKAKDMARKSLYAEAKGDKKLSNVYMDVASKASSSVSRQSNKGKAGYDKDGYPLKKQKNGGVTKKMQAGGVMTPSKRVGPIDPNGAYTKVQERTIAGKKAPKVPLKKDKQLGATKMKKGGVIKKK
jgi:hypothetical protein